MKNITIMRYGLLIAIVGLLVTISLMMFTSAAAQSETAVSGEDQFENVFQFEADAEDGVVFSDDEWVDWDQIVADTLDITVEALWDAYVDGRSATDLAIEQGVDVQLVIDALVAAEIDFINQLVDDGELDADEAELWIADTAQYVTDYVEMGGGDVVFSDDEWVDWDQVVADALGITSKQLCGEYESGASAADVAIDKQFDPQLLIDALVAAEEGMIQEWVIAGDLTEDEATEWLTDIDVFVTDFVNMSGEDVMFFDGDYVSWESIAGELLGMSEEGVWQAFDAGRTIADLAEEKNVSLQGIVDALVTAESEFIADLVDSGSISAEEGDEWLADVSKYVTEYVSNSYGSMMVETDWVSWEAASAEVLGVSESDIWQAYEDGKSMADVASGAGVDVQLVIDAIVTAETELIQGLVTDGEISQEDADEWTAELAQIVTDFVTSDVRVDWIDVELAE